jgi:aminocarboxymuconate-semialdehyde decarboxylase
MDRMGVDIQVIRSTPMLYHYWADQELASMALAHLIYSGVFDRYPRLKVCAVHGGGFLPYSVGRFDHAFRVGPESHTMLYPPSHYPKLRWECPATAGVENLLIY